MYRKNELHQVAQQASNIEDLTEVVRASLSVMSRQWSDAMHTFKEKFNSLSTLITDHGNLETFIDIFCSILMNLRKERICKILKM
jgi:anaphase-promoting complex subunit 4